MSSGEPPSDGTLRRGQVWWANLGRPKGSAPGYRRPVLVIQSDPFNTSRINTTIVAAITSNLRLADAPGNVALAEGAAGLPKPSVVDVSQIATVNRAVLATVSGELTDTAVRRVDEGVRLALGL